MTQRNCTCILSFLGPMPLFTNQCSQELFAADSHGTRVLCLNMYLTNEMWGKSYKMEFSEPGLSLFFHVGNHQKDFKGYAF